MEIFTRVVEAKSFSGAARRMNISKSVVSKHVTEIERSLGVRLLNRTTRAISLTEVGAAFYERCSRIVAAAEEAEAIATRLQSVPRGTLKVNVPVAFGVLHIVPALPDLLSAYPDLRIEMTLSDRTVNLAEEGYDAAVLIEKKLAATLVARKLAPNLRRICATPDYLRRHGVPNSPRELANHNCIVYAPLGTEKEWCLIGQEGTVWIEVDGNLRLNNENAIRYAALSGLGMALLPSYIVGPDLQSGALRAVLPDYTASETAIYAVYLSNRHLSAKVRCFVDFLVVRFGPTPPWDAAD